MPWRFCHRIASNKQNHIVRKQFFFRCIVERFLCQPSNHGYVVWIVDYLQAIWKSESAALQQIVFHRITDTNHFIEITVSVTISETKYLIKHRGLQEFDAFQRMYTR